MTALGLALADAKEEVTRGVERDPLIQCVLSSELSREGQGSIALGVTVTRIVDGAAKSKTVSVLPSLAEWPKSRRGPGQLSIGQ